MVNKVTIRSNLSDYNLTDVGICSNMPYLVDLILLIPLVIMISVDTVTCHTWYLVDLLLPMLISIYISDSANAGRLY